MVAELAAEPTEDAGSDLTNGCGGDAKLAGYLCCLDAIHDAPVKNLPRPLGKVWFDLLHRSSRNTFQLFIARWFFVEMVGGRVYRFLITNLVKE